MAMNRIQFQPGLSMPEFLRCFGTEEQCAAAVAAARWPNGFACPRCGTTAHCAIRHQGRRLLQCNACRHRFNRRFDLKGLVARLVVDVCRAAPRTAKAIRKADEHC